jgi:hypothetical protein
MQVPAMAVGGVAPVLPPLLILFLVMAAIGGFMLAAALIWRNMLLVTTRRLNPFRIADVQKAADPGFSTRPAGAKPFSDTLYARVAFALLGVGGAGIVGMGLWGLFSP